MDPLLEEYTSPFDFEAGVNTRYLYLSPPGTSVSPPGSPAPAPPRTALYPSLSSVPPGLRPDSLAEVGEDAVTTVPNPPIPALTEEEEEELRQELAKVEDEIVTLSQVLAAKERQVAEMKRKLGITPLNELRHNLTRSWQEVTTSTAYKKTSETLSQAGQKATAAFSSVGSAITRKLEDVSIRSLQHSASMPVMMRNLPSYKSFEEKVGTLKTKMSPTESQGDHNEGLSPPLTPDPISTQPEATPLQDGLLH